MIIEKEKQFSFNFYIQGYHTCMEIWLPKVVDDNLYLNLKCEDGNEHDKYAVVVTTGA